MTRETFLLLFVTGAATLALWVVLCLPRLTPRSLRAATVHMVAALLLGFVLGPALRLIPGQPAKLSDLAVGDRTAIHATPKGKILEADEVKFRALPRTQASKKAQP